METFLDIEDQQQHEVMKGFKGRFIHTAGMTISYWEIKQGSELPEHKHPHEQVSKVLEGEFELIVNGVKKLMVPGKLAVIPSNVLHSGFAKTDCLVMDIFQPVREDYKY